jgi:hypothetical protein
MVGSGRREFRAFGLPSRPLPIARANVQVTRKSFETSNKFYVPGFVSAIIWRILSATQSTAMRMSASPFSAVASSESL